MKQTLEIEVPEGYEAKFNPDTNKIDIIKKYNKPRTWEEFCNNYPINVGEGFIDDCSEISIEVVGSTRKCFQDRNVCINEKEAAAFLALMQLRQLRKAWVGDWGCKCGTDHYSIYFNGDKLDIGYWSTTHTNMSFPKRKMAEEFLNCFSELLEKAKILL